MVRKILEEHSGVVFGVGSSQFEHTKENPFSFEERSRMIQSVMETEGIGNYRIVPLEDFGDDELWVNNVRKLVPEFGLVYSNDPLTIRLFRERQYDVRVMPLVNRNSLSGTEVRKRMLESSDWQELVPEPVRDLLIEIGGAERMRKIVRGT